MIRVSVGDHAWGLVEDRIFADTPGRWLAQRVRERR
jgi:hypothetical protein